MRFKESETVELKKSTSELKEAIISIGAMLNKHSKAILYFGIDDTQEPRLVYVCLPSGREFDKKSLHISDQKVAYIPLRVCSHLFHSEIS